MRTCNVHVPVKFKHTAQSGIRCCRQIASVQDAASALLAYECCRCAADVLHVADAGNRTPPRPTEAHPGAALDTGFARRTGRAADRQHSCYGRGNVPR